MAVYCTSCGGETNTGYYCVKCGKNNQPINLSDPKIRVPIVQTASSQSDEYGPSLSKWADCY